MTSKIWERAVQMERESEGQSGVSHTEGALWTTDESSKFWEEFGHVGKLDISVFYLLQYVWQWTQDPRRQPRSK